jgi:hypothetical protein
LEFHDGGHDAYSDSNAHSDSNADSDAYSDAEQRVAE